LTTKCVWGLALGAMVLLGLAGCGGGGGDSSRPQPFVRNGNDRLQSGDQVNGFGYYIDYHNFKLTSRRTLEFTMTSNDVDPFIGVLEGQTILGYDDDSGIGNDSQLFLTLDAGEYSFRCTSASFGTGAYHWEIREVTDRPVKIGPDAADKVRSTGQKDMLIAKQDGQP
jgi:hypothetical protein